MSSRRETLERMLASAQHELEKIAARPAEPGWDEALGNPVVRFDVAFRDAEVGRIYSYAAIRCGEFWYVTQAGRGVQAMTWDALMDWLESERANRRLVGDIWLVSAYEALS
jgi:hypothetical protein